ncbi:MAG: M1 family metallopeptidase [Sideroxyarcus sp.]|nr:M1 family metallopeptidase [Sideroxyarcus sp.]
MKNLVAFLSSVILFNSGLAAAQQVSAKRSFDVTHYAAQITPDISGKTVSGKVRITYVPAQGTSPSLNLSVLRLDAGELQIDAVAEDGVALTFEKTASQLNIHVPKHGPKHKRASAQASLDITYHGTPKNGMQFAPDVGQVITAFSTSQWLPCIDAPDNRASFDLTLILPADLQVVANGRLLATHALADGKVASVWSQQRAMPSYLYGFAAGHFREVTEQAGKTVLRYLTPARYTEQQVRQIFRDTADMLAFYQSKAGVAYRDASYTQVLSAVSVAQEVDGFALMGERYGERVLADEKKIWLGTHELSHQWWGNNVSNHAWTEFWLNEGIACFMNAAYIEHRFGRDAYLRQIAAIREQVEKVRIAGKDKSLIFPDWEHPSAEDRSLAYDKGAYVTYLLREQLGDELFWKALRAYTIQYWGESVSTSDFQNAMEKSSGKDLSAFFNQWVYLSVPN